MGIETQEEGIETKKDVATDTDLGYQKQRPAQVARTVAWVAGIAFVLVIVFAAGVTVGLQKARFSYDWGRNYERNFIDGPRKGGGMGMTDRFEGRGYRNGHGMGGEILSIAEGSVVIRDFSDRESTVVITDRTVIRKGDADLDQSDLKTGDRIVVIGKPREDGVVSAGFIRVFDADNFPDNGRGLKE